MIGFTEYLGAFFIVILWLAAQELFFFRFKYLSQFPSLLSINDLHSQTNMLLCSYVTKIKLSSRAEALASCRRISAL